MFSFMFGYHKTDEGKLQKSQGITRTPFTLPPVDCQWKTIGQLAASTAEGIQKIFVVMVGCNQWERTGTIRQWFILATSTFFIWWNIRSSFVTWLCRFRGGFSFHQ